MTPTEVWAVGNMTVTNSDTLSSIDDNISVPFSEKYNGVTINPLGQSASNTSIFSSPSPDNPVNATMSLTLFNLSFNID